MDSDSDESFESSPVGALLTGHMKVYADIAKDHPAALADFLRALDRESHITPTTKMPEALALSQMLAALLTRVPPRRDWHAFCASKLPEVYMDIVVQEKFLKGNEVCAAPPSLCLRS